MTSGFKRIFVRLGLLVFAIAVVHIIGFIYNYARNAEVREWMQQELDAFEKRYPDIPEENNGMPFIALALEELCFKNTQDIESAYHLKTSNTANTATWKKVLKKYDNVLKLVDKGLIYSDSHLSKITF